MGEIERIKRLIDFHFLQEQLKVPQSFLNDF